MTITRSFSRKIQVKQFEPAEFYCAVSDEFNDDNYPNSVIDEKMEELSADLHKFCEEEVNKSIKKFMKEENNELPF